MNNKLIVREGFGGSGVDTAIINAISESLVVDVEGMTNIVLWATQVTDNGTVTLDVEISPDGVTWGALGAALTEASFVGGNGAVAAPRVVEGTNGLPMAIKQARIRSSVYTGTGVYSLKASGFVAR